MKLKYKITLTSLWGVVIITGACLWVERSVVRDMGIQHAKRSMRAAILAAEDVRKSVASMNQAGAFQKDIYIHEYEEAKSAGRDITQTALYQTIPVVASWRALETASKAEGFKFHIARENARNPKNLPTPEELKILNVLKPGTRKEYFSIDEKAKEITYARPIVMSADCLSCHGDPSRSLSNDGKDHFGYPMEGWKTGEVQGAFVLKAGTQAIDIAVSESVNKVTYILLAVVSLAIAITLWTVHRITSALTLVEDISAGNLNTSSLYGSTDELGVTVRKIRSMVTGLQKSLATVDANSHALAAASRDLNTVSAKVLSNAQTSRIETQHVSETSLNVSRNLQSVAAATEEMNVSINDIARNAAQASTVATRASAVAKETTSAVTQLGSSSHEIGEVISVITQIAEQTKLLALNATIEAARAGEAGKGFTVVANEVKELAKQTAVATEEIREKINSVQSDTEIATTKIAEIAAIISEITMIQMAVAAALDQQAVTTLEISKNVQEAAAGGFQISQNIQSVSDSVQNTAEEAVRTAEVAKELAELSSDLRRLVNATTQHAGL
ncbi:MAG: methyl-accepting chemotaxis protein [Verrucomicrobiota bacterium]